MLAVFVTLLLGILSFALMWQMESISTTMSEQWMRGVDDSRAAETYFVDYRLNERTYLTSTSESSRQTGLEEMNSLSGKIDDVLSTYQNTLDANDAEEVSLLQAVEDDWSTYQEIHEKMFAAADAGNTESAIQMLEGEGMTAYS